MFHWQYFLLSLYFGIVSSTFQNKVRPTCNPNKDTCSFSLTIARSQTMMIFNGSSTPQPLYVRNNNIYKRNCEAPRSLDTIRVTDPRELENVIVGGGTIDYAYTINGQFPGPTIVVYEGQKVRIKVRNKLLQEGIGIHWHGLSQKGTFYMDGVPSVTQCSIGPEDSFLYEFKAEPVGTHWYHSHEGAQRSDGMFGAFVVLPKPGKNEALQPNLAFSSNELPDFKDDFVMFVQDWYNMESNLLYTSFYPGLWRYFNQRYTDNSPCYMPSQQIDGADIGPLPYNTGLINGKGANNNLNLYEVFEVKYGNEKFYRFRVLNPGMMYAFRIGVDQHKLTVFNSDGFDFEKREVDFVVVSLAERYDFYIKADQPVGNYWIRAQTLEELETRSTFAILRYDGANVQIPSTSPRRCSTLDPCTVLNCPFRAYPAGMNMNCINVGDLKSQEDRLPDDIDDERFLMFHFAPAEDDPSRGRSSVNGIMFETPSLNIEDFATTKYINRCDPKSCKQKPCKCTHVQQLKKDQWVQLVLISHTKGQMDNKDIGAAHPVHLHGHHFWVIKVGYPIYDDNNKILDRTPDVECIESDTQFCRFPRWTNPSWSGGKAPGLKLKKAILKDTVQIPTGGYVVIRFKTDNPGRWMMHCHMELHQIEGMALIIQEGTDKQIPEYPENFPKCGTYNGQKSRQNRAKENDRSTSGALTSLRLDWLILMASLMTPRF